MTNATMGSSAAIRLLPNWVEADPLRGRAIDALGLQATADQIADLLAPGLSVLTIRARYFSLLAWARQACGTRANEFKIHRLEVALAIRESQLHAHDIADEADDGWRCRFVGRRMLLAKPREKPPADPREVYKVPAWRRYRASMENLGLLSKNDGLTADGEELAKAYSVAAKAADRNGGGVLPPSACLCQMTGREGVLLAARLGLWRKGRRPADDTTPEGRRDALERELRTFHRDGYSVPEVLEAYEMRRDRDPSLTVGALREAAVWERLSVGLHAVFLLSLHHLRSPRVVKHRLIAARRKRRMAGLPLAPIPIDEAAAMTAVQSVRRALELRNRLRPCAVGHCDSALFDLGEELVGSTPIDQVLRRLEDRHFAVKHDDAWIRCNGGVKELARDDSDQKWQLPWVSTLRAYRLAAFGSILADLKRARR